MVHLKKVGKLFQLSFFRGGTELVYDMNWKEMVVLFCLVSSIMCKFVKSKKK